MKLSVCTFTLIAYSTCVLAGPESLVEPTVLSAGGNDKTTLVITQDDAQNIGYVRSAATRFVFKGCLFVCAILSGLGLNFGASVFYKSFIRSAEEELEKLMKDSNFRNMVNGTNKKEVRKVKTLANQIKENRRLLRFSYIISFIPKIAAVFVLLHQYFDFKCENPAIQNILTRFYLNDDTKKVVMLIGLVLGLAAVINSNFVKDLFKGASVYIEDLDSKAAANKKFDRLGNIMVVTSLISFASGVAMLSFSGSFGILLLACPCVLGACLLVEAYGMHTYFSFEDPNSLRATLEDLNGDDSQAYDPSIVSGQTK